jgi:hypothetical protein
MCRLISRNDLLMMESEISSDFAGTFPEQLTALILKII